MRGFVTGRSGFVGGWLTRYLEEMGDEVVALSSGTDVTDGSLVAKELAGASPDVVYHLAALTHVGRSWEEPAETMRVNVLGTLAVLEAARHAPRPPRVILVSSAEVYGGGDGSPLSEDAPLLPTTPYAASKVAAEYLGVQAGLGGGLDVVRIRPFNHVGPGQSSAFVISALAERIVAVERAGGGEIAIGNLAAARDFTDVRDVVRAYRLLAELGVPGEVYNVCSGELETVASMFERLVGLATVTVTARHDPALERPVDVPVLLGDGARLHALTGWRPEIALDVTLADVLAELRRR